MINGQADGTEGELNSDDTAQMGAILFDAARQATADLSSSSSDSSVSVHELSPAPSADSGKANKKRKREE